MTEVGGPPQYAIIVATKDRGPKISQLLESIVVHASSDDYELIVVDQSEGDATEQAVAPYLADLRFRYERSRERGLSRGRNLGIARTTAPYLVITDDDCMVPPGWLRGITRPFRDDARVGVVFCSVEPVPFEEAGHTPHIHFDGDRRLATVNEAWRAARQELPLGAGMAVRRAAYDELSGFDELLGAGARFGAAEDSDLSWRGLLSGWTTAHIGDVTIVHDGFRDLVEFRALVDRDFFGVGGAMAKYLRAGSWRVRLQAAAFVTAWLLRFGVMLPAKELATGHRPRGLRRPLMLLRGVLGGLRTRLDSTRLLYGRSAHLDGGT